MVFIIVGLYVFVEAKDVSIEYNSYANYRKITPSIQVMRHGRILQATFAESGMILKKE